MGWPSVKAILGEKVIPGWLDHYLGGKAGWEGQMMDAGHTHHATTRRGGGACIAESSVRKHLKGNAIG